MSEIVAESIWDKFLGVIFRTLILTDFTLSKAKSILISILRSKNHKALKCNFTYAMFSSIILSTSHKWDFSQCHIRFHI